MDKRLYTSESTHHFNVLLACKLGIEKAILLQNLEFWIRKNIANDKHFYDGSHWTYNTASAFSELFPYLKSKTIARYLQELEQDSIILSSSKYNKDAFNRTKWYSLTDKYFHFLRGSISQNEKWTTQNEECKAQNEECYNKETDVKQTDVKQTDIKHNHVVLPEGKTTPLQIDFEKLPSMLENLHTCQDEQDGCVSESENCVLEKNEEGAGAKIQFSEKFKINPTAENKFLGLSKTKQTKVIEVMEAFVDITEKRDGLTKERLGNILARLGEQVLSGDDEAVNVELKHFKAVFEYKNEVWQNDAKMRGYIQIETLCSGKFHKYLEEAREAYKNKQKPQGNVNNQQPAKRKLGGIG